MAVGVDLPARKPASRLDQTLLLHSLESNAMSFDPPPHISGSGSPSTDIANNNHSSEEPLEHQPTSSQGPIASPLPPSSSSSSSKKRRPSKGKVPTEIRRSSSTPHMHNLSLTNTGELSPTDKRRNKLGYHRTSVACGHCRRRKIRCLVADGDPTGRCANCIRLKRECNFYPVEQNPEAQRPQAGSAKEPSVGAPASSTTSSPRHPPSVSSDKLEEFRPSFGPASTLTPRYGIKPEPDMDSPRIQHPNGMHPHHPPFPYPHTIDTRWPPATGFLPSSTMAELSPSSSPFWGPSPSAVNSTYGSDSNVSGGHTPAAMSTTSNLSFGSHHDGPNWGQPSLQQPTRSMSYGIIEGLPQQYASQGLGLESHDFPRRASPYSYPTTLDTTPATLRSNSVGNGAPAPLSAPIVPNQQYTCPPPWPYGGMQPPPQEMHLPGRSTSAQWYGEPGQLDQVQEEGVTYNHPTMPQF